jgi:hypothetical protein
VRAINDLCHENITHVRLSTPMLVSTSVNPMSKLAYFGIRAGPAFHRSTTLSSPRPFPTYKFNSHALQLIYHQYGPSQYTPAWISFFSSGREFYRTFTRCAFLLGRMGPPRLTFFIQFCQDRKIDICKSQLLVATLTWRSRQYLP